MDLELILQACRKLDQIDGRMEQINLGQPFHVIVDFAHTPDGMEQMLQFGRKIAKNHKVISVFGSAGKRDVHKRKVFGELADKYADYIILTEDDPRDEDPAQIADQIKKVLKIPIRYLFKIVMRPFVKQLRVPIKAMLFCY